MFPLSLFPLLVAFTGQVFALNVQMGDVLGNLTASQLLDFGSANSFVDDANCTSLCGPVRSTIQTCGSDDSCTCKNETGTALLSCEQCLLTVVVDRNIPSPNPLIGSQSALDAFVAACLAPPVNTTVQPLKMTVPPSMMGPMSIHLSTPAAAVAVTAGTILGGSFLFMLASLE